MIPVIWKYAIESTHCILSFSLAEKHFIFPIVVTLLPQRAISNHTTNIDYLIKNGLIESDMHSVPTLPLAASGDVQAYQIRAAPTSTIAPGVVMASSPALPTQGATEEVTRKREVRLMKNRYEQKTKSLSVCVASWR